MFTYKDFIEMKNFFKTDLKTQEQKRDLEVTIRNIDKTDTKLNDDDIYEIELYKSFRNDPFFKHYLYNHLSFYSEKIDEAIQNYPYSVKGNVSLTISNFIKYNVNSFSSSIFHNFFISFLES